MNKMGIYYAYWTHNWDEICKALKEINYRGAMVMEPFFMPGGEVGRDISVYRDLQNGIDLDKEAKRALEFIRNKMQTI